MTLERSDWIRCGGQWLRGRLTPVPGSPWRRPVVEHTHPGTEPAMSSVFLLLLLLLLGLTDTGVT